MTEINYHGRHFRSLESSESGEAGSDTTFHYRQDGELVWATYDGGEVRFGTLVAVAAEDGALDLRYHHVNKAGELKTGVCRTRPEVLPDGRLRLHEQWRWTSGDGSRGASILEEIPDEAVTPSTASVAKTEAERVVRLLRSTFDGEAWHGPSLWPLVANLTVEQAAALPAAGAHTVWQLVGHAAGWIDVVRQRVTTGDLTEPEENFPLPETADVTSWHASLAALRHAHETLCAAVVHLSEERLSAVDPCSRFTIYEMLHGVIHHNLYHAGQIAILSRSLGIDI